jgi:uncharacterized membrane protein HdeD (DUF308 family)
MPGPLSLFDRKVGGKMSTASTSLASAEKKALGWSIVLSVFLVFAGILAIVLPPIAGLGVTILVGWLLIFSGVGHLVYGWQTREKRGMIWEMLLGVLYIGAGAYVLWNPILGLVSLTLGLAAYLVVEAILEFILAVRLRPAPGSGWLFVDGIVTLILAMVIWRTWPLSAAWVIGTLVGISMVFSGMARLMLSIAARKLIEKQAT